MTPRFNSTSFLPFFFFFLKSSSPLSPLPPSSPSPPFFPLSPPFFQVGTLKAYAFRGCVGFVCGIICLACVVVAESLVVLCVLSTIVGLGAFFFFFFFFLFIFLIFYLFISLLSFLFLFLFIYFLPSLPFS